MHFLIIALVVIMAGTLLLAKTRKDGLGKFFSFVSWFNIFVGFILFILVLCGGVCKLAHHCKYAKEGCSKQGEMKCCGKEMKMGNCCFSKHFGYKDDDGEERVVYIITNKDMKCDSSMMAGCMKNPDCMRKAGCGDMKLGCDKEKPCCDKKIMMMKEEVKK